MTPIEPKLLEQLSAWMDGELPADEARFLQRRLKNNVALREQWERWQVGSACLRDQPVRLQGPLQAGRVQAGITPAANEGRPRATRGAWLASAAALLLAAVLLPGVLSDAPAPAGVAVGPDPATLAAGVELTPTLAGSTQARPPMSPLPSVRDFPLVDTGGKVWPRSPLIPEANPRGALVVRGDGSLLPVPPPPASPAPEAGTAGE